MPRPTGAMPRVSAISPPGFVRQSATGSEALVVSFDVSVEVDVWNPRSLPR